MQMMKPPASHLCSQILALAPQALTSIKQMFIPSRGIKPFRLELPLKEENPISHFC